MPKKLSNDIAKGKIHERCLELDYTFLGFNNEENEYIGQTTKLILKCNKCGKIWNTSNYTTFVNLKRQVHCCKKQINLKSLEEKAILKIKNTLSDGFIFDGLVGGYSNAETCKFFVICKTCGERFVYSYPQLMVKNGDIKCKNCQIGGKLSLKDVLRKILEKCEKMNYTFLGFDNKENTYKTVQTRLILKCNKCGRVWKTTTFDNFMRKTLTCDGCNDVWKMEVEIEELLTERTKVEFFKQQKFEWLKNKNKLSLDFYIPSQNIAIECQGKEHFVPCDGFGGEKAFLKIRERDIKKKKLCEEHGIKIIYYSSEVEDDSFLEEVVIHNKTDILNLING